VAGEKAQIHTLRKDGCLNLKWFVPCNLRGGVLVAQLGVKDLAISTHSFCSHTPAVEF
jgi:hypothetical protein